MSTAWPAYAQVTADGPAVSFAASVRRTGWDDGAVRQERIGARTLCRREVRARIPAASIDEWLDWVHGHGHERVAWTDVHDGTRRWTRIVGGAGGVSTRPGAGRPGTHPDWLATLTLEGYLDDVVPEEAG